MRDSLFGPGAAFIPKPETLLNVKALQHYFAYYLQQPNARLENILCINRPVGGYLSNVVKDTEADDKLFPSYRILYNDGLRQTGSHTLSELEFARAADILRQDENLLHSFATMRLTIQSFMEEILYAPNMYTDGRREKLDAAITATSKAPFAEELLPAMIAGARAGITTGREFALNLTRAFRDYNIFTSIDRLSQNAQQDLEEPKIAMCPFRKVVGHLFNTDLQEVDGGLAIAAQPSPGALPALIYRRMQQIFPAQSAAYAEPAPVTVG